MIRLYLIGIAMGVADLIPGVSGGTIAFICGIYEELLESIKTLQLHSFKKIAWPFLLPLGSGILTAVFFAARLLYYLLIHYEAPVYGFFLGVILASILFCGRKAGLARISHWSILIMCALLAFFVAGMGPGIRIGESFLGLVFAGMLAGCAMLLPGISGSYLLQLMGIYPLALAAVNAPSAPGSFSLLLALALGVALGFILFSRVISWLLTHLPTWTYSALVGCMLGGARSIWPFSGNGWGVSCVSLVGGFLFVILLEVSVKKNRSIRRV